MTKTLVIARVFPPRVGGSGRWMWELYSRLPRGEFLVVADNCPGSDAFDMHHDLPIVRLPLDLASWGAIGWRRGSAYIGVYRKLLQMVREHEVDTIHAACCLPEGFVAWMLRRRTGVSYYVYVHGEELNVARTSRELTWMTRNVLSAATLVIANSHNTAEILQETWAGSGARLRVLHPGVDTQRFCPAPRDEDSRRRLGWNNRRVILTTGRLQKRKGHDQIIRALPAIRKAVPDVLYAIVGAGDERASLLRLAAELGMGDQVVMHGELPSNDLVTAYQQCDLFVLPNREVDGDIEGFGIVLLEAQACGIPVIAGASGGTSETMDPPNTGLLIDCAESTSLANVVSQLLLDMETRRVMGHAARQWAADHFDWNVLVSEAQAILNSAGMRHVAV
jgi:phosphatidylinositol alpha-1,6-mannosyltransferase